MLSTLLHDYTCVSALNSLSFISFIYFYSAYLHRWNSAEWCVNLKEPSTAWIRTPPARVNGPKGFILLFFSFGKETLLTHSLLLGQLSVIRARMWQMSRFLARARRSSSFAFERAKKRKKKGVCGKERWGKNEIHLLARENMICVCY